ncbi:PRTRC system protein E [Mucilaginibacter lappiensis]|uniref:PRTRC genetic system protein E n=1 Tax=Mucilaginibacter lappiensis TaxID=354630 RepID=A0ABR6PDA0_9SPHI|nr:PRTRC system protein E [Mucilaginibacter lappiensis]MBB6107738.1 PRTRC genetic system protein E [Mucilaginibacter lappiensis]SIP98672.1 PRTRC system protein E [Mucilaginibacter lappiensis]
MTTNFFQNIASLNVPGVWKIGITTDEQGHIKIMGLFNIHNNGTQAAKVVPPFILSGTPEEMDSTFFDTIANPVKETAGIFHNMEDYRKGLDRAKALSKPALTDKAVKTAVTTLAKIPDQEMPDPKLEKKKAYETAMKTIGELNASCKYEEAILLIPALEEYPEKGTELKNLRNDLNRKKEQLAQIKLL